MQKINGVLLQASKNYEIANILNEAHIVLKGHLNDRGTADYVQTTLHCY